MTLCEQEGTKQKIQSGKKERKRTEIKRTIERRKKVPLFSSKYKISKGQTHRKCNTDVTPMEPLASVGLSHSNTATDVINTNSHVFDKFGMRIMPLKFVSPW
jgi:hypothetical protein